MSFSWKSCADLIKPTGDLSLSEVLQLVKKGKLTPYDENGNILLPEKFLLAQQKEKAHAKLDERENHLNRGLDELFTRYNSVWNDGLSALDENDRRTALNTPAEPEREWPRMELDAVSEVDALTLRYNRAMAARKSDPMSYVLSKFGDDRQTELHVLTIRCNSVRELLAENHGEIEELGEWKRVLAEHSERPWESLSLSFTPREDKFESDRIAGKAFFKEAEVEALTATKVSASIEQKSAKKKRQDQQDREAVEGWAREYFEQLNQDSEAVQELKQVAEIAQKTLEPASIYEIRCLEDWIRPFHPLYTPGKPGRKKSKQKP